MADEPDGDKASKQRDAASQRKGGPTPREIVEQWRKNPSGVAIPTGLLDLCRIGSELADQAISPGMGLFVGLFSDVLAMHEQAKRMRMAGWLPHPVLPIADLVGPEKDAERIRAATDDYVAGHDGEIYDKLLARFASYHVEPYTCQLAQDAVAAHREKLFRLIVPSVFPEIERCARTTLRLGMRQGKAPIDRLIAKIKNLPISELDAFLAAEALDLMDRQIFKSMTTAEDRVRFQDMPHRHGSQTRPEQVRDGT